ncbi:MAG: DtxR family transcriptional regulator [Deltaproteobacteria bacterium]|nr:DtxR family transcriptional regulator [Deltaproteobacteria bacterium]
MSFRSTNLNKVLTDALEDYLETIYIMVRDKGFARVKDIANARCVKSASVSPAMRRLAKHGLIKYVRREYIALTPDGEKEARRIYARHQVLERFFLDVLDVNPKTARNDACAIEHFLSPQVMDRIVRFFEFLDMCPEGQAFITKFQNCSILEKQDGTPGCHSECTPSIEVLRPDLHRVKSVADLNPGEAGRVTRVKGHGAVRQRLLDMGILPDRRIEIERIAPAGDPIWIKLGGFQLSLRRKEAETVMITTG